MGSSGQLWAFGNGAKGQIGTGQPEDSLTPTLVQLPWTTDSAAVMPNGTYVDSVLKDRSSFDNSLLQFRIIAHPPPSLGLKMAAILGAGQ